MMINLISYSVGVEVVWFYNKPVMTSHYASDACNAHLERLLQKIDGVSEVYGLYELSSVEVLVKAPDQPLWVSSIENSSSIGTFKFSRTARTNYPNWNKAGQVF